MYKNKSKGDIVAFISTKYEPELKTHFLRYIVSHPEYEHRGFGRELLKGFVKNVSPGDSKIRLTFNNENKHLSSFYINAGFKVFDSNGKKYATHARK